ncbi:MAG: glycerol-3-phosphate dehydrogenase [Deltaproteobacteria bacterium]|nr:glycerol-3-phosphate dehydrogenase [Deltaproteobacteria bacterium]
MAVVTVVGAGMMGSALTVPLVDRGHEVRLVGTPLDHAIVARLREDRHHLTLRHALPEAVRPYAVDDLSSALAGADAVALGVSSAGIRWAGRALAPLLVSGTPIFAITKGLEWDGERLRVLPDVFADELPASVREGLTPAAIAGPCIAGELARRVPTCVVLTGRDQARLDRIADLVRTDYYRVFTSLDVEGVETCAALKNAFAMGVAFGAGLHERRGGESGSVAMHNYESAVMAQAVVEMMRVVELAGGTPRTAAGLAGVGDLDVTNNGGRTGRFGRLLGRGLPLDEAVARMEGATLECLEILAVMRRAMTALGARGLLAPRELPLLEEMARVALDGAPLAMPFHEFFGGERG